jgi:hypothetical protein
MYFFASSSESLLSVGFEAYLKSNNILPLAFGQSNHLAPLDPRGPTPIYAW